MDCCRCGQLDPDRRIWDRPDVETEFTVGSRLFGEILYSERLKGDSVCGGVSLLVTLHTLTALLDNLRA